MSEAEIAWEKIGCAGVITLARPRALNALSFDMIAAMRRALDAFARDPGVGSVVVRSASATAFCAGADIKRVAELGAAGHHAEQLAFLGAEYCNCRRIRFYPKPYVALIDGIIMGGGAGIAINGAHRVVGERVSFAMPEVGIGFFPDVGASYFLPRLPARIGVYLALTGGRAALGDLSRLGLQPRMCRWRVSTHSSNGSLRARQRSAPSRRRRLPRPRRNLLAERDFIARSFAAPSLAAVLAEIEAAGRAGSAFAQATSALLGSRSPTSLAITFRQMQLGAGLDFDAALRMEFRIASRIVYGHDFYEGVRAVLIDKDHAPRWDPASVDAIAAADIDAHFAPLPDELEFSVPAGAA